MTTEIAVLNQQAVALSADSAVSTTSRVFQSANKIFSLSKIHPVGIMVYSSAQFMGVPIETIVKLYRENLGTKCFSHINDYAKDFLNFINTSKKLKTSYYSDAVLVESNIMGFSGYIKKKILDAIENEIKNTGIIEEKIGKNISKQIASEAFSAILTAKELDIRQRISRSKFIDVFKDNLDRVYNLFFSQFKFGEGFKEKYYSACYDICTKIIKGFPYSGLVFAGYGEDEIFPSIETYRVGGIITNELHHYRVEEESESLSPQRLARVIGFAQHDMIQTFMGGAHPRYLDIARQAYDGAMKGLISPLMKALQVDQGKRVRLSAQLTNVMDKLLEAMYDQLAEAQHREFVDPIMETICILSPSEIANLAEAMVNLTTLQRQFSVDQATVGGPTDVALISKCDGFIWIKRKHYFQGELNHHFFKNYFRRCGHEEGEKVSKDNDL